MACRRASWHLYSRRVRLACHEAALVHRSNRGGTARHPRVGDTESRRGTGGGTTPCAESFRARPDWRLARAARRGTVAPAPSHAAAPPATLDESFGRFPRSCGVHHRLLDAGGGVRDRTCLPRVAARFCGHHPVDAIERPRRTCLRDVARVRVTCPTWERVAGWRLCARPVPDGARGIVAASLLEVVVS
jgi:hypothetical protein